jgi:uncharacterized membrane protein
MKTSPELRASERIPIGNRVKVIRNGRIVVYALAVNLSLGGIRLNARTPLQVGSPCKVAIPRPDGGETGDILAEGIVIRNDDQGTVLQFVSTLAKASFESVVHPALASAPRSLLASYRDYFRVSRSKNLEQCESLLGVTKTQFRTVFYSTFSSSIVLATLPVWLLRASIPAYPNGVKILLAFTYGALWLILLQPSMDLAVFRMLRSRVARK